MLKCPRNACNSECVQIQMYRRYKWTSILAFRKLHFDSSTLGSSGDI